MHLLYAGTIDRVGWLGGRRFVIDIKTGGKYPWYRLQLAAYANLLDDPLQYSRAPVTLYDDGSFVFDEFPRGKTFRPISATFRSSLKATLLLGVPALLQAELVSNR